MMLGPHNAMTRKDGVYCCAICECPFVEEDEDREVRLEAEGQGKFILPNFRPVDDRPCVPTKAYARRQRWLPVLTVFHIACILLTQGPKVWGNRVGWWLFGGAYSSGCSLCGGTGRFVLPYVPPDVLPDGQRVGGQRPQEVDCGSCNSFHD